MALKSPERKIRFQVVPVAEALSVDRLTESFSLANKEQEKKPAGRSKVTAVEIPKAGR